jgi:23S rRNA (adenine2503-C2)-methyltransferase
MSQADIRKLSMAQLEQFFLNHHLPSYRAQQVFEWLWKKQVNDFSRMTNLPVETRQWLSHHFTINTLTEEEIQHSSDGTIKTLFRLHDGQYVEGVLIPQGRRMTACISSQVGCSLTCRFCATGKLSRIRNLEAPEIFDQVVALRNQALKYFQQPLTNVVYMGMGEPLLNYREVLQSVHHLTSAEGLGLSPQRITLSTAGISKMICRLADDQVRFNLALSLHAVDDRKRSAIMSINEQNNVQSLKDALTYFIERTGNRVTLEYILFDHFNDSIQDAETLIAFTRGLRCKVNLIEYNPVEGVTFQRPAAGRMAAFKKYLEEKGRLIVNVRRSRGKDIQAACGQLAGKSLSSALTQEKNG